MPLCPGCRCCWAARPTDAIEQYPLVRRKGLPERMLGDGRYLRFGIREHAMGAILNGIAVSGLARAYGATFLVFSDYMRGAIRVFRPCKVSEHILYSRTTA